MSVKFFEDRGLARTQSGMARTQLSSIVAGLTGGWGRGVRSVGAQLDKSGARNPKAIGPLSNFSGFRGGHCLDPKNLTVPAAPWTPQQAALLQGG